MSRPSNDPPQASMPPSLLRSQNDEEHLRLLEIFHYVYAGLMGFVVLIMGIGIGVMTLAGAANAPARGGNSGPELTVMVAIFAVVMLFVSGWVFLTYLTGRFIGQRRHRMFCMIVSGFHCASFPLGTALGVFTIIVLARDSVIARFEQSERAAMQGPPPGVFSGAVRPEPGQSHSGA